MEGRAGGGVHAKGIVPTTTAHTHPDVHIHTHTRTDTDTDTDPDADTLGVAGATTDLDERALANVYEVTENRCATFRITH